MIRLSVLGVLLAAAAVAQTPKPIFDGRLALKPGKLSAPEEALMTSTVAAAARKHWRESGSEGVCEPGHRLTPIDIADGAFTRPHAQQRAILYKYCTFGHGMALDGIAVIENGRLAAHVVFEGGENHAIGALPDINGNGLSEILVAGGGTNQGITSGWIFLIELSGTDVVPMGQTETLMDDCGVNENGCKITANRILVTPGKTPVFYREAYMGGNPWKKAGALSAITLDKDHVDYEFVR